MSSWLRKGLSLVYQAATSIRNYLYQIGFFKQLVLQKPVISVGNITVGGTGKTPITQLILTYFKSKKITPAVVSRNYKAVIKGTAQVDTKRPFAAQFFGDEPTQLAFKNPEVAVFVGPSKKNSALLALEKSKPDIIIVDDGFQHRALHRNLDIVLLDATVALSDYDFLPLGKARESFTSLVRADVVLLTKVNFVGAKKIQQLRQIIPPNTKVFEVAYHLKSTGEMKAKAKVIAFSGLARPESFKQSLLTETKFELIDFLIFPDHHSYSEQDMKMIFARKTELGAEIFVTTEKDWMKVKDLVTDSSVFQILDLVTEITGPTVNSSKEFYAILDQVIR